MNSKISTVIVRWRNGKELERCIASLLAHGGSELEEIIVVDSGSGDGGGERLQQAFHNIEVVQLEHNRSFAWAANQGVARTCGDFVLLLNPDTEITEGSLEVLVGYLMEHPNAAGAVPLLVEPDGSSQHHWQLRCLPRLRDLALGRSGRPQFPNSPTQPTQAEQPAAAAWCIRRVVWDALEGLHSGFAPAWWEDVDFCVRLAALEQ
ncbi:MAG: glycosyltransferase family 2 protein, partial [bacterium]|nr:glycosyltransferase family 2 protein [bacterium]